MILVHVLKTWPEYFGAVLDGTKPFEIRKNDRGFKVGDCLHLIEWDPRVEKSTGRKIKKTVSYLTDFAQQPGFVVLGLAEWRPDPATCNHAEHGERQFEGDYYCRHCDALIPDPTLPRRETQS